jgi:hypothetical protein
MFCVPVFLLIHWFFSLSNFVIPSKCFNSSLKFLIYFPLNGFCKWIPLLLLWFCTCKLFAYQLALILFIYYKYQNMYYYLYFLWLCSPARGMASSYHEVSW